MTAIQAHQWPVGSLLLLRDMESGRPTHLAYVHSANDYTLITLTGSSWSVFACGGTMCNSGERLVEWLDDWGPYKELLAKNPHWNGKITPSNREPCSCGQKC